jgi:hypothetical protein
MRDSIIITGLFSLSIALSPLFPHAIWGIIALISLGYILERIPIDPRDFSITEHLLAGIGIGLLIFNVVLGALIYTSQGHLFKPVLLTLFVTSLIIAAVKNRRSDYIPGKAEVFPWIAALAFFLASIAIRHADFRIPDEYLYLYGLEGIIEEGQLSPYARGRVFFFITYSGIMRFSDATFRSTEITSLFFTSLSLIPTYLLGKELFDRRIGQAALLFLVFNPSFIFYSIRLLPWAPSIFLLTSYLYFLYRWTETRSKPTLLLASIFLSIAIFVKLHGLLFLGLGILYLVLAHWDELDKRYLGVSTGALLLLSWHFNIPSLLWRLISRILYDLRHDVITAGYKTYVTYFAPDLYGMPFVLLFFSGISAFYREKLRLKLFLLIPIVAYILAFSDGFGMGVRHFLVVVPLMSIIAARGLTAEERSLPILFLLTLTYFAILGIMILSAPVFPHLVNVIPDIPLWMRALTFGSGGITLFLILRGNSRHQATMITMVVFASLLNAHFFVNMQDAYPDDSREGLKEAGRWLSENTPRDARIQSTTGELDSWRRINRALEPEALYPKSTFLSYYVDRTTYAVPENEEELLKRIEGKEIDYVVVFSHFMLTESEPAEPFNYTKKYISEAPSGTELVHTGYDNRGEVQFRVYRVK